MKVRATEEIFSRTTLAFFFLQNTMMSITRPTRRGPLFLAPGETVVPPRKPLLSRHYESIELQLILPQFRVKYLTSFARQTGAQVDCQLFNFVTYQQLSLIDYPDGLARTCAHRLEAEDDERQSETCTDVASTRCQRGQGGQRVGQQNGQFARAGTAEDLLSQPRQSHLHSIAVDQQ